MCARTNKCGMAHSWQDGGGGQGRTQEEDQEGTRCAGRQSHQARERCVQEQRTPQECEGAEARVVQPLGADGADLNVLDDRRICMDGRL